ncbi:MAG: YidC/Oxa1 family membrane protein insertase [Candidatus Doudnabacteria bacterium]|nr:YidC/Oxa1 family membrane protein insertase [Candidatus Doudnabacteria bacterium]
MVNIFNQILVYPLLNLLVFFYNYIPDIGAVIILVTILVRLALLPSFHKSLKHQRALTALQPKMHEIREKYKDDKEAQAKAMMELYKVHNVNPMSSCLPLLLQLPILIALYRVFIRSLAGGHLQGIYSFIKVPESINPVFLHWLNLSHPNIYMGAIAGVLQYYLSRISLPPVAANDQMSKMMSYQTMYFLPLITIFFGAKFPAGLTLYWIVTTLFGIAQQYYILHKEAKDALAKA